MVDKYWPHRCDHCHKFTGKPKALIKLLFAFDGVKGPGGKTVHTMTSAAEAVGVSRQALRAIFNEAESRGYIERISKDSNTFKRTTIGTQLRSNWYAAGYTDGSKKRRSRKGARV